MSDDERPGSAASGRLGWLAIVKSVAAAFFGVQTEANRQRDFTHGKLHHFIIVGALATLVFVVVLVGMVHLILASAGA